MSDTAQTPRTATPVRISTKPASRRGASGHPIGETRTACIRTFGCQMNVHDSDRMRRMILDAGYAEVHTYEDADLVILNTCYVRENAVDRVRGHLRSEEHTSELQSRQYLVC